MCWCHDLPPGEPETVGQHSGFGGSSCAARGRLVTWRAAASDGFVPHTPTPPTKSTPALTKLHRSPAALETRAPRFLGPVLPRCGRGWCHRGRLRVRLVPNSTPASRAPNPRLSGTAGLPRGPPYGRGYAGNPVCYWYPPPHPLPRGRELPPPPLRTQQVPLIPRRRSLSHTAEAEPHPAHHLTQHVRPALIGWLHAALGGQHSLQCSAGVAAKGAPSATSPPSPSMGTTACGGEGQRERKGK